jgi:shikimate kinase
MLVFSENTNITLIGYRGVGKSTVGRRLAERMRRRLLSTDVRVIEIAAMPIPEIVEMYGWDYFRALEVDVVKECSSQKGVVIDSGGGVVTNPDNVKALKDNGIIIWLKATPETISSRIANSANRPPLTKGKNYIDEIKSVLAEREPLYKSASDWSVSTDNKDFVQVVDEILNYLGLKIERL